MSRAAVEEQARNALEARMGVPRALSGATALAWREVVRFLRDRTRVFGALAQPLLFWALFAGGLRASFRPGEGAIAYGEYFFPGTVVMILLFTAIFSTISLIEDRREGFLQGVLVAPVPRSGVVLGKILGGTVLAVLQGCLVLLAAPLAGIPLTVGRFADASAIMTLVAFALTALSFCIAWKMESTQGFHAIMTVLLMPLWLLSGAFFPAAGAPGWLRLLMAGDPLTYGMAAFRRALYPAGSPVVGGLPSQGVALLTTAVFGTAAFVLAVLMARRDRA